MVYPVDGKIFELTLDGDSIENDPLEMIRHDFIWNYEWKHIGKKVTGIQTCRFKLVSVEFCFNLAEVIAKISFWGKIPEGQWRNAFRTAFPNPDPPKPFWAIYPAYAEGKWPVGVADPSWIDPSGFVHFPFVHCTHSSFPSANDVFSRNWCWLVQI